MSDEPIIITGATSGIGLETTRHLLQRGIAIIAACRRPSVAQDLFGEAVQVEQVDLADLASVHTLADRLLDAGQPIGGLLNNAGVMPLDQQFTKDGFEACFGVNYLAPFVLTERLLPLLERAEQGRIVHVSSVAHKRGQMDPRTFKGWERYRWFAAYAQSKLAQVMHVIDLDERLKQTPVTVNALHPGVVGTDIVRGFPGPVKWAAKQLMMDPARAARVPTDLLTNPAHRRLTGEYLDRWQPTPPAPRARDRSLIKKLMDTSRVLGGLE